MDIWRNSKNSTSTFISAWSIAKLLWVLELSLLACLPTVKCWGADEILLLTDGPTVQNLILGRVNLTPAIQMCKVDVSSWKGVSAVAEDGSEIPFQFVPDVTFDAQNRFAGLVILRLPENSSGRVRLRFSEESAASESNWDGTVRTPHIVTRHNAKVQAGFPAEFQFVKEGKTVRVTHWAERVHDPQLGSFLLSADSDAVVERLGEGPLCTVVRVRAKYRSPSGKEPPGRPSSVYDWVYFHDEPIMYVRAHSVQEELYPWSEHHFLELQFHQQMMPKWFGGDPQKEGDFGQSANSFPCPNWAFITDGQVAMGMFGAGQVLVYDAPGEDGNYIQARGSQAWRPWTEKVLEKDAFLWFGTGQDLVGHMEALARTRKAPVRLVVTTSEIDRQRQTLEKKVAAQESHNRQEVWWQMAVRDLEQQGRLNEALELVKGNKPANWYPVTAGDLGMIFELGQSGARVVTLQDISTGASLATSEKVPLFEITLRKVANEGESEAASDELRIRADDGWQAVEITNLNPLTVVWRNPQSLQGGSLEVVATVNPQPARSALEWTLSVQKLQAPWTVWQVAFPQLAVRDLGPDAQLLYPQGCGIVASHPWSAEFDYRGRYPSGWTTMQFMAVYRGDCTTGLYFGLHDPWASTKEIIAAALRDEPLLQLRCEHWAPNMGKPGNGFELSGRAVWQVLHGDWYDAAQIYRRWVVEEAKWYPQLGTSGREDSPAWMRELPLWALYGGPTNACVEQTKQFADFFGVPCGVHWYNWHMNPFDNDYPHYFPTKPEFPDGVQKLRAAGIHVMPYINGRLWDTRDKGMEDYQFTSQALVAASKNEQGEPYIETYGSKESDGSPVRLAVMCPTTELWQTKVREIVLRLFQEYQVDAVYIDQIAAAAPTLCMDENHRHPLGGGHWWTEGYWKLLDEIRLNKPKECMITTECNGEPYIRWFDGYLTWHWQYDGQVPAFPAIYGGAI